MKKVVITGLGAVSSVGMGKEAFFDAAIEGRSGVGKITRFDASGYSADTGG